MWVTPIVLCALAAWAIYANDAYNTIRRRRSRSRRGSSLGGLAGIPFGMLRGMHTDVRPTERRGVMYLGSSWVTLAIFIVAFGLRYAVRSSCRRAAASPLRSATACSRSPCVHSGELRGHLS